MPLISLQNFFKFFLTLLQFNFHPRLPVYILKKAQQLKRHTHRIMLQTSIIQILDRK